MRSATRTVRALASPTSRRTTSTRRVTEMRSASDGCTTSRPAATIVPTSASASVTVCSSRSNTARWTSRTPARNAPLNALPPTASETIDSISGRAATRSGLFFSTSRSVTRSAISERTLSSVSATVARLANWSESTAARRTYPTARASTAATAARTTRAPVAPVFSPG
jgi:hypothetical protein